MEDDFENSRHFLDLCYFTVSLSTDPSQIVQFFKSDFVNLVTPIIRKFITQSPEPNERQITSSPNYPKLVNYYVDRISTIIEKLKQSGLWMPQGLGASFENPINQISIVLDAKELDLEHARILRSVRVNSLIYTPELTLYFHACLKCCQSVVPIMRIYAYCLLRNAPKVVDIRHMFLIFKDALQIWDSGRVSFEFNASFYLLLSHFAEHRPSHIDQNEHDLILKMLVPLHSSENFENLMCFDPSLKWMYDSFTDEALTQILNECKSFSSQNFLIVAQLLAAGKGGSDIFLEFIQNGMNGIRDWCLPIQIECRKVLGLISSIKIETILDVLSDLLMGESGESILYIFAEFLVAAYFNSFLDINPKLLDSLILLRTKSESKPTLVQDINNIIFSISSNPARFILIKNPKMLPILKEINTPLNSLVDFLVFSRFTNLKAKHIQNFMLNYREIAENNHKILWELPAQISLQPDLLLPLLEALKTTFHEDLVYEILQIALIVVLHGKAPDDIQSYLPSPSFICEYTGFLNAIHSYEKREFACDENLKNYFVVGSTSNLTASFLFEHIVWNEGKLPLVIFRRLQMRPALWFNSVFSSFFQTLLRNPETIVPKILQGNSVEYLVGFVYLLFQKLIPEIQKLIIDECFSKVCEKLNYPRIEFCFTGDDEAFVTQIAEKYQPIMQDIFALLVSARAR